MKNVPTVFGEISKFFSEVRNEFAKVIWPTKQEFIGSIIIVLFIIAFFAIYLGVVDFGLSRFARSIFGRFGIY